jgi:hypothetical protein
MGASVGVSRGKCPAQTVISSKDRKHNEMQVLSS